MSEEKSTALVDIQKELANDAALIRKRLASVGAPFIKCTQDKKFQLPDGTQSAGPMSVVIIDFAAANYFYDRGFVRGETYPAACYALGLDANSLVPGEDSPVKQADSCSECPNNEFGSKGKGKACSNSRLLAVVNPTENDPTIYLLKVSATGIKSFDNYVQTVKTMFNTVTLAVVTDIYFDAVLSYGSLRFGNPRPNPKLEKHFGLRNSARALLLTPPDLSEYVPLGQTKEKVKK